MGAFLNFQFHDFTSLFKQPYLLWDEVHTGEPGVQDFCPEAQTSSSECISPVGDGGSHRWVGGVENVIRSSSGNVNRI